MEQGINPPKPLTGEDLIALLEFKYASKPHGQHIFVKELEINLGSGSIPEYKAAHQDEAPVVRTEYCELETLGLTSYKSLHTVIKVGKQVLPIVARIIPGMNVPLMLGNYYRDLHAEDPDTQRKVNAVKHKKIFFLRDTKATKPKLTLKVLKRMHLDMKRGSFADMTAECKRLGGMIKKSRCQDLDSNTGVYCMCKQRSKFYNREDPEK